MIRRAWCCGIAGLVLLTAGRAAASEPPIDGNVGGMELCPQYVCGAAVFVGTFRGTVDGRFAVGTWVAAVQHEVPLPDLVGQSRQIIGGRWRLTVWVVRGFFFQRVTFSGAVAAGGRLTYRGGNEYRILTTFQLQSGVGTGDVVLSGVLSHSTFPPSVGGTISSPD